MFSINKIPTINSKYVDCCRLCLVNNDTLESYHTQDSGEMSYFVKISGIMPSLLNNSSELLPQSICKQCREKLNVSYDFIINCFNTNKVLNQYVKDVTSETSANDTTSEEISSSNKETNENNNHTVSFLIFKNNFVKAEPSIVFSGTDFSCFNPLVNKEIDLEAAKTIVDPLLANTEQINELSYQGIKIGDENTTQFEDVSVKMEKPPEIDLPSTSTSTSTSTADTQNCGNSSNDNNAATEKPPKRRRGPNRMWTKIEEFESAEEAEDHILAEKLWRKSSTKITSEGQKVEYRCREGKYRVKECPAGLYLLYHVDQNRVSLYATESGHENHDVKITRGLDFEMKHIVRSMFNDGVRKPNAILALLRRRKMQEPPKSKLITFLKQIRGERYGPEIIGAGLKHLEDLAAYAMQQFEEDSDENFCID